MKVFGVSQFQLMKVDNDDLFATFQVADLTQHLVKGLGRTGRNGPDKSSRNKKRREDKRPRNGANRWAFTQPLFPFEKSK